ncbi:GntG family PLP-dependent aldolase [Luedemannella flava]|uniref:GntG family PLP-dependent aldolase n=1 Tax=Luedemannella flava TaxID=349316 RepID=A0ABN2LZM1_9ACTN
MIDLRSESSARLDRSVRAALFSEVGGNDTYDEDAAVHQLETFLAELFGMSEALFVPTGRMANIIAASVLCPPEGEILLDVWAHMLKAEYGSLSNLLGRQARTYSSGDGLLEADAVLALVRTSHTTRPTRLVCIEDPHIGLGGSPQPWAEVERLTSELRHLGVASYCDGARLWYRNPSASVPWTVYGSVYDALAVSLVKGPGAPVGAALLFRGAHRSHAIEVRRALGGGWARPGPLANAALAALEARLGRMTGDCELACRLGERLAGELGPDLVSHNINMVELRVTDSSEFFDGCKELGVLLFRPEAHRVRAVVHQDIAEADVDRAVDVILTVAGSMQMVSRCAA